MSIRSPFFYVGDKYKLMPQLSELFPEDIEVYIEPFVGGGSSFLNTNAETYHLNDVDEWIIKLHKKIIKYAGREKQLFKEIDQIITNYGFSYSLKGITVPEELKKAYPKTYYAKYNKASYNSLKTDFNKNKRSIIKLYILLVYGFNHMIRFNSNGEFNLPVGDVDFNKNVYHALHDYLEICDGKNIIFYNKDFRSFIDDLDINPDNSYVYCDPPYLISASEYNRLWSEKEEEDLYEMLDYLNENGIRFGLTNLVSHKGKRNDILVDWCQQYNVYNIKSNYISFNDNSIKTDSEEIFVTNYER